MSDRIMVVAAWIAIAWMLAIAIFFTVIAVPQLLDNNDTVKTCCCKETS